MKHLTNLVVAHRQYKGIEPADPDSVRLAIERQICSGMPPGHCHAEPGEDYRPFPVIIRNLNYDDIMRFMGTMLRWLKSGTGFVSREQSHARANVCRGCHFNRAVPQCACAPLWELLNKLVPKDREEPDLRVCGLCSCALKAKVLAPAEVLKREMGHLRFPAWCWMTKENAQA